MVGPHAQRWRWLAVAPHSLGSHHVCGADGPLCDVVVRFLGLVLVLVMLACSSSTGTEAKVMDCQGIAPQVRPSELILACGDGAIRATDLRWTSWSATAARGSGKVGVDDCTPNCAIGSRVEYPANFELSAPAADRGATLLTELVIRFSGTTPAGQSEVHCRLADSSHEGGCVEQLVGLSS